MTTRISDVIGENARSASRSARPHLFIRTLSTSKGRWGFGLASLVLVIAFVGPFLAPHDPNAVGVVTPLAAPSGEALLGGDLLGRDTLSRVLSGGAVILLLAAVATLLAVLAGAIVGVAAAYFSGWRDHLVMRIADVILSFPSIVLALLLVSVLGGHLWLLVLAVALGQAPQIARVVRSAALDIAERDYVKVVAITGVKPFTVMRREVLPNLTTVLLVEAGIRFTTAIIIMAGLSFPGFGFEPPNSNWGYMINENRAGMAINVWPVFAPVILISILAVGVNLFADALAQTALRTDPTSANVRKN